MTKSALVDTNILIYAYDRNAEHRHKKAVFVLDTLYKASAGYLSVKTISEFFAASRRLSSILPLDKAVEEMEKYIRLWPVLDLTPQIAIEAARGVLKYQFSYWDAQIWATAKIYGLTAVFSENMHTGGRFDEVSIINPLADNFDLQSWLKNELPPQNPRLGG